jgi:hypothetical protein
MNVKDLGFILRDQFHLHQSAGTTVDSLFGPSSTKKEMKTAERWSDRPCTVWPPTAISQRCGLAGSHFFDIIVCSEGRLRPWRCGAKIRQSPAPLQLVVARELSRHLLNRSLRAREVTEVFLGPIKEQQQQQRRRRGLQPPGTDGSSKVALKVARLRLFDPRRKLF